MARALLLTVLGTTYPPARLLLSRRALGCALCGQMLAPQRSAALPASTTGSALLCDQDISVLSYGNRQVVLVGTAHVSEESATLVRQVIRSVQPDTVMVELDRRRAGTLLAKAKARKSGTPLVISGSNASAEQQSRGAAFYKSLDEMGFPAGGEFVAAIEEARLLNATVLLGDQDINVTLQRLKEARAETRRLRNDGILSRDDAKALIGSLPSTVRKRESSLTAEGVAQLADELKQRDNALAITAYLKKAAPPVYDAMIGERDQYMAHALEVAPGNRIVAVVGLAHVEGIERILGQEVAARASDEPRCL